MRLIRGCFIFIGVIAVLALLALAFGYYLLSLTPPLWAQRVPVVLTAEAVESLNQKLETLQAEIKAAVEAKEERQVSLTITEEEANSKLVEILAEDRMPLEEILLNFRQGSVFGYSILHTPGFKAKVAVRAAMEVTGGKARIVVEDLNLGRLPLPRGMNKGAGYILHILTELITVPGELPWQVTAIQIADGQVTITGIAKKG